MALRKGGLFLPLDVGFFDDEVTIFIREIGGDAPITLYLAMCLLAKRLLSDGYLTRSQVKKLNEPNWEASLKVLVKREPVTKKVLIQDMKNGRFYIAGWRKHNVSAAEVVESRAVDAERKRNERATKKGDVKGSLVRLDRVMDGVLDVVGVSKRSPKVREEEKREEKVSKGRTAQSCPHGTTESKCAICRIQLIKAL
jgi:hypothetical protein